MATTIDCTVCNNNIRPRQERINCDSCDSATHRTCTSIGQTEYRLMKKGLLPKVPYMCDRCIISIRPVHESTRLSDDLDTPSMRDDNLQSQSIQPLPQSPVHQPTILQSDLSLSFPQSPVHQPSHCHSTIQSPSQRHSPVQPPPSLTESSIADPQPMSVSDSDGDITYTIVQRTSIRNKDKLYDSLGFSYVFHRETQSSTTWRCSVRNKSVYCKASIRVRDDNYIRSTTAHICVPEVGIMTCDAISARAKQVALENPLQSAAQIATAILQEHLPDNVPCPSLKSVEYLAYNANKYRKHNRPKDPAPTDIDFVVYSDYFTMFNYDDFVRCDVQEHGARYLVCCTDDQLCILRKAKVLYIDATFKLCKLPFMQLFSIHAFVRSDDCIKQVPLVVCFMTRRRKRDYVTVFSHVLRLAGDLRVKRVVMDFEMAMWRSVKKVLPNVQRQGCAFHFVQAVFTHIKGEGLQGAYTNDDGTYQYLQKLMNLCMIPAHHIPQLFTTLEQEATDNKLQAVTQYMRRTWIDGDMWTPEDWSVYGLNIRTNNDVEGWHNRMNLLGRQNMSIYVLIPILQKESSFLNTQLRLVSNGKLTRKSNVTTRKTNDKVSKAWNKYQNGDCNVKQLLKACSKVYKPK